MTNANKAEKVKKVDAMLTKFVLPGEKVELQTFEKAILGEVSDNKVYTTKVFDIIDDEQFEVVMPMEQTKLVLLPVDGVYDMCFYTKNGLFQAAVRIVDRYKDNNIFILRCELVTSLKKYQRREYYRFSCVLAMKSRLLDDDELAAIKKDIFDYKDGLPMNEATIVDISGGGIRFVTRDYKYESGDIVFLTYTLHRKSGMTQYELVGKILASRSIPEKSKEYEHRLQYIGISKAEREEIIRYIFEEERKNRQKKYDI